MQKRPHILTDEMKRFINEEYMKNYVLPSTTMKAIVVKRMANVQVSILIIK